VDPEHEAEFNRWYDEEHIKRLLEVLRLGTPNALSRPANACPVPVKKFIWSDGN
jgi:hypothetical protein